MEMLAVFLVQVIRCHVGAPERETGSEFTASVRLHGIRLPAVPPMYPSVDIDQFEVSVVEMNRWDVWISRMDHR